MERLASDRWRFALTNQLSIESLKQVDQCFARGRDPYGRAWASKKKPSGPILQKTGALRRSWIRSAVLPSAFRIESISPYAAAHQYGTQHIVPRAFIPYALKGLGFIWSGAFEKIAVAVFRKALE